MYLSFFCIIIFIHLLILIDDLANIRLFENLIFFYLLIEIHLIFFFVIFDTLYHFGLFSNSSLQALFRIIYPLILIVIDVFNE